LLCRGFVTDLDFAVGSLLADGKCQKWKRFFFNASRLLVLTLSNNKFRLDYLLGVAHASVTFAVGPVMLFYQAKIRWKPVFHQSLLLVASNDYQQRCVVVFRAILLLFSWARFPYLFA